MLRRLETVLRTFVNRFNSFVLASITTPSAALCHIITLCAQSAGKAFCPPSLSRSGGAVPLLFPSLVVSTVP